MITTKILDDLASRLADTLPVDIPLLRDDLQVHFRTLLDDYFVKQSLVTRTEFDAQQSVLARTREKLHALEQRLLEIEKNP